MAVFSDGLYVWIIRVRQIIRLNLKMERLDNPPNLIHLFFFSSTLTDFEDRLSVPSLKTANKCCAFRNITKKLSWVLRLFSVLYSRI